MSLPGLTLRLPSISEFHRGVDALIQSHGASPISIPKPHPVNQSASLDHVLREQLGVGPSIDQLSFPPGETKQFNKRYTTEQGDFIVYALHDLGLSWDKIEEGFPQVFPQAPKRTKAGLQAWYYRLNLKVPVWDKEGWLIFDSDAAVEPRTTAVKCRAMEREHGAGAVGLSQRYPERLVMYEWVDDAAKQQAQDWGEYQKPYVPSLTNPK